jgi:diguanylate cyclase (GGDEF)-like protein
MLPKAKKTDTTVTASKPRVSIRTRIMILALLLVVPLMIDRVRLLESTRTERIARTIDEVADLAQRGTEAQSEIINSTRALLQVVARTYVAVAGDGPNCTAFVAGFAGDVPWIRALSIVGPDDRIACSTRSSAVGIDLSDREYIQSARLTRDFTLSKYLVERSNNEPAIMAAYPVPGNDERAGAIILAPVDLQWVERFAQLIDERKGATAFLLDGHGAVLSRLPGRGRMDEPNTPNHPLIRAAMSEQKGALRVAGLDGVHRIYAFSELPGTDTRIVVGIDEREALGRIDRDISIAYFQLTMFGVLAMLLAWFGGERFIIAPIRALARTAASIGRGELEARPTRGKWTVEFAPLAAAMADMAKKLAERERDLRAANCQLEELASIDSLSGLPNRRSFDIRLSSTWLAAAPDFPISLVMMDVDHFKLFNDTHGHLEGDNCLRTISRSIDAGVRRGDFAARYGGEEFIMLLPGADADEAFEIAERSRQAIEALHIPHQAAPSGTVSVSVGVATLTVAQARSERQLIEAADAALYEAKRRGRNTVAASGPLSWPRQVGPRCVGDPVPGNNQQHPGLAHAAEKSGLIDLSAAIMS